MLRVGNSSITYRQVMVLSESAEIAAVNKATSVLFDLKQRGSAPIPDTMREKMPDYLAEVAE